jgi:hypothetical protein
MPTPSPGMNSQYIDAIRNGAPTRVQTRYLPQRVRVLSMIQPSRPSTGMSIMRTMKKAAPTAARLTPRWLA